MATEETAAVVRRMVQQSMIDGDIDASLTAYAPDFIHHNPVLTSMPDVHGLDAVRLLVSGARAAFPDMRYTIERIVADDDMVAVLYTWQGTHQADLGGVPATGRVVSATGAIFCRVAGGRIVEQWDIDDRLDVMQQLGLIPLPGRAAA